MAKQRAIKVGDKVRVERVSHCSQGCDHGLKFGGIATVLELMDDGSGDALVRGPMKHKHWNAAQFVSLSACKLAKQAMKVKA